MAPKQGQFYNITRYTHAYMFVRAKANSIYTVPHNTPEYLRNLSRVRLYESLVGMVGWLVHPHELYHSPQTCVSQTTVREVMTGVVEMIRVNI